MDTLTSSWNGAGTPFAWVRTADDPGRGGPRTPSRHRRSLRGPEPGRGRMAAYEDDLGRLTRPIRERDDNLGEGSEARSRAHL